MNRKICFKKGLIFSILYLFLISSCDPPIPVETIEWEPDDTVFRQFKTNDKEHEEYTFWYYMDSSYQDPMTSVETRVKKVSGSESGGFGIVFCVQDHDNFYIYVINITGQYAVYKREYGSWSVIIDWPSTTELNQGINSINVLRIDYNSSTSIFTLYANDTMIDSFSDSSFNGGCSGYECHISGTEGFPAVAEDFRFAQILPTTDP